MGILPKELSAEELALQKHYSQLKKVKKQLQDLKATRKQEQQALSTANQGTKRSHSENAEEATEQAKKLLKAGAIKLEAESKEKTFKRSALKKAKDTEKPAAMTFQPYVPSTESSEGYTPRPKVKDLYKSFVSSHTTPGSMPSRDPAGGSLFSAGTAVGRTLRVSGSGLTETVIRKALSSFGIVSNVTMEQGKSSGFVTLGDSQSADEAVDRLNGVLFMDIKLSVEIAGRQPGVAPGAGTSGQNTPPATSEKGGAAWAELAVNRSKKGAESKAEQRTLVTYEDSDIF